MGGTLPEVDGHSGGRGEPGGRLPQQYSERKKKFMSTSTPPTVSICHSFFKLVSRGCSPMWTVESVLKSHRPRRARCELSILQSFDTRLDQSQNSLRYSFNRVLSLDAGGCGRLLSLKERYLVSTILLDGFALRGPFFTIGFSQWKTIGKI